MDMLDFLTCGDESAEANVPVNGDALDLLGDAVSPSVALAILTHVLVAPEQLRTTNLDIQVEVPVPTSWTVQKSCLPFTSLRKITKAGKHGRLQVLVDTDGAKVKVPDLEVSLPRMAVEEFPEVASVSGDKATAKVRVCDLVKVLKQVAPAMSQDSTRYNLNGVLVEVEGRAATLVATDGHRLHLGAVDFLEWDAPESVPLHFGKSDLKGFGVSRAMVNILVKRLRPESTDDLLISVNDTKVSFEIPGVIRWTARRHDEGGVFPDYRQVIPRNAEFTFDIRGPLFFGKLDKLLKVCQIRYEVDPLTFKLDANRVQAEIQSSHYGMAYQITDPGIACDRDDGIRKFGVNANYLMEALTAFGLSNVKGPHVIKLQGEDDVSPLLITAPELPGVKVVLMPMRV